MTRSSSARRCAGLKISGTLRIDTSFHALRDTATLIWGEADPAIESAAYHLKQKEISPVVRAGSGFYIIVLSGVRRSLTYASLASDALRDRVLDLLRRRKEKARLEVFAPGILRGKTGYASPIPLNRLIAACETVFANGSRDSIVYLTPERAASIDSILAGSLGDTLAVAGSRVWNVGDVVARMSEEGFGVHRDALGSIPLRLNTELMGLVQRELLGEEALRRGLDTTEDVRREVEIWRQSFLASMDREEIAKATTVSDADVWNTLKWRDSSVTVPQVRIRELRTSTFAQMQSAMDALARGVPMEEVVRTWSSDPAARENGRPFSVFPRDREASHRGDRFPAPCGRAVRPARSPRRAGLFRGDRTEIGAARSRHVACEAVYGRPGRKLCR